MDILYKLNAKPNFPPIKKGDFYSENVKEMLEKNCSAGSCHQLSQYINLTKVPFDPRGSYTMDKIVEIVGQNP